MTLVVGRAGIGKTATAREGLRARRAIEVDVRPGDDLRQVLLGLARALGEQVVLPNTTSDVDALGEAVVAASEHVGATIMVDDLHHLAEAEARRLLERTRDRARVSRWIFVTRVLPRGRWKTHAIELDDLGPRALTRIARGLVPDATRAELSAIVLAAQGSPWLLRRSLGTRGGAPPDPREVAAALPPRAAPLLRLLAALHLPIDATTARILLGGPLPRGPELVRGGATVRAHDALRDALAGQPVDDDLPRRLDAAATQVGDARAAIEAARLHLEQGRAEPAAAIFDRIFDDAVEAGLAPLLYGLLHRTTAPALSALRLRAAIALGAGPTLDEVLADPRPVGVAAQTRHAEALLVAGRLVEARALLLRRERSLEDELLLAHASLMLGALDEAAAIFETIRHPKDLRVRAFEAVLLLSRGEIAAAVALADELGGAVAERSPTLRRLVQSTRLRVYNGAGMLQRASAAARSLLGGAAAGSLAEELSALASLATGEIANGNLVEGRRLLAMLGDAAERAPALRFVRRMNALHVHIVEGNFPAAREEAEAVITHARITEWDEHERWGLVGRSMVRLVLASDVAEPGVVRDEVVTGDDAQADFLRALRWMRALRANVVLPPGDRPQAQKTAAIDARVYALVAEATDAFLESSWDDATELLARAIALAEENGYRTHGLEARLLLFDTHLAAGRAERARAVAREVGSLARTIGSRRFTVEAELGELLVGARPRVDGLERIAECGASAPAAARRAQALLGLTSDCDRIDRIVVAATPWQSRIRTVAGGLGRSWGIDFDASQVWFPDGRVRTLARHAQQATVLGVLARGAATKEALASAVWGVRDYHRLRDDKRIHVAIMRLRHFLEDRRPRRILSTADGYAIGTDEPMRVIGG